MEYPFKNHIGVMVPTKHVIPMKSDFTAYIYVVFAKLVMFLPLGMASRV
jgi:hypothetical protein